MNFEVGDVELLTNRLVFIDGIGRAGKFFMAKLVSSFENTEYFQFNALLEQLPALASIGILKECDAKHLMKMYLNMSVYERYIGRNLNLKKTESSSLTNSHEYQLYEKRTKNSNDHELFWSIIKQQRLNPFLIHECVFFFDLFQETFPNCHFINIQRHPLDLTLSWSGRGWGDRLGTDPLSFSPFLQGKKINFPWYATDWKNEYESLSPTNRIARTIAHLTEKELDAMDSNSFKEKGLDICYELFFTNPDKNIKRISEYLNEKPIKEINDILAREGCYKKIDYEKIKKDFQVFEKEIEIKTLDKLYSLATRYEKKWDLKSYI